MSEIRLGRRLSPFVAAQAPKPSAVSLRFSSPVEPAKPPPLTPPISLVSLLLILSQSSQQRAGTHSAASAVVERLHGDLGRDGFCVEAVTARTRRDWDWACCFGKDALELCLNIEGRGEIRATAGEAMFLPGTAGLYFQREPKLSATRRAEERHLFVTVRWARPFIERTLGQRGAGLVPAAHSWLTGRFPGSAVGAVRDLSAAERVLALHLRRPPLCAPALPIWYRAKTLELAASFLFEPNPSPDPASAEPIAPGDLVRQAISILAENPAEPPGLGELARRVGASPFHFSRLFSKHAGMTIPQFIRKLRVERAAELLSSGGCNVTEAALEVGYSSLSHFSKAFCKIMGCCPCLYPSAHPRRKA
jgi:AraC-like DNA-binding protein